MSDLVQAAQAQQGGVTFDEFVTRERTHLEGALAGRIDTDRFIRAAVTSFRTTPELAKCEPSTVLGSLFLAAQIGLEVGGPQGHASIVPFKGQAQLIIEYRGYIELFYRSGARKVECFVVRQGDEFKQWSSAKSGKDYHFVPLDDDTSRPLTGVVAQVMTAQGDVIFEYMSKAQVDRRKTGTAVWRNWYDEMALKTVIRRLAKTVRLSPDLAQAAASDEAVNRYVPGTGEVAVEHAAFEHVDARAAE